MIVYIISFILYLIIFALGMFFIQKRPAIAERAIHKLAFLGFVLQLLINWGFWGDLSAFNPIAIIASQERSAINLLFLSLISIFCYSALFVGLLKSNEYYNGSSDTLSN